MTTKNRKIAEVIYTDAVDPDDGCVYESLIDIIEAALDAAEARGYKIGYNDKVQNRVHKYAAGRKR